MITIAWQREARGSDAGALVEVSASARTKMDLQLLTYRGVDFSAPLAAATGMAGSYTNAHTTPTVDAEAGYTAVQYWADKTSATTDWVEPEGTTVRGESIGAGGGRVTLWWLSRDP